MHWRTAAALAAGRIDMARALVVLAAIGPLGRIEAAAVEAAVLPVAGGLTTGELRAWLARLVLVVDPAAARRRREQAERHAHVACWADPEGTATLAGRFLPPAEVLAADRRLAAIAAAWKKAGAQGGLDLLRAHAYLALLLGQDTTTPPTALLTPLPVTGTVNLTIPLITLLGLADRPGEVPGHGPLHADTARDIVEDMCAHSSTRWNVIITDPAGRAMGFGGSARARRTSKTVIANETTTPAAVRGSPSSKSVGGSAAPGAARGSPITEATRGSPIPFGAGGWTITLTTEPIAPYY